MQLADDLFRVRFANPVARRGALAELIPGTQSGYFHTALDHPLAGREAEFQTTMAAWKAVFASVASFGFLHADVTTIREYLENSVAVSQLGQWLASPRPDVRPQVHLAWESLEFDPLVNPRASLARAAARSRAG